MFPAAQRERHRPERICCNELAFEFSGERARCPPAWARPRRLDGSLRNTEVTGNGYGFPFRIWMFPLTVLNWISGPPPLMVPATPLSNTIRYLPPSLRPSSTVGGRAVLSRLISKSL